MPNDVEVVVSCRNEYREPAYGAVRMPLSAERPVIRLTSAVAQWRLAGHPVSAGAQT